NITMEETAAYSVKLAQRVGNELQIPVYLYEASQPDAKRNNLSVIRAGEYEGFAKKITEPDWKPDFGPQTFNIRSGATVIGARDFLIAYNVNLNTKSVKRANSIAFDIREAGRVKTENGKKVLDAHGNEIRIPGLLKGVKAIGWYIDEYKQAQVSINITRFRETPLHVVFDACVNAAHQRGYRVTGSELVGLVPLSAMLDAGRYFLNKQKLSSGVSDDELIHIAVKSMGLDELAPFNPKQRIIEFSMAQNKRPLVNMNLEAFANETASDSPAPGGGSISAYVATLGVSLGIMVANLSASKTGWESTWQSFSDWAEKGQLLKKQLLDLVDEDTAAYNKILDAFQLPKATDEEKQIRKAAVQAATRYAIEVPARVMEVSYSCFDLIAEMVKKGNPNSVTDAAVGALCIRTAVMGAHLNVQINTVGFADKDFVNAVMHKCQVIADNTQLRESEILAATQNIINKA
ncbi:MAG TPA: cyclodeaminase/cyclohydrolase family protein, partial [Bacteroidia bacterium]|nr:cyclodeaminase/cyclohydrolase family protein [Bacteroidia bacterium]